MINSTIIKDDYKINLTQDQDKALNKLLEFINDKEKAILIEGYAGTGKTTLITLLIPYLLKNNIIKSVAFSAPTNKAVNVIIEKYPIKKNKDIIIDFLTIHKLLKYKSEFNNEGKKVFVKNEGSSFKLYNLVIVDECSMLSKEIVKDIKEEIKKEENTKIILIGDPAQLPPINEEFSSIFKCFTNRILLKQVVRSGKQGIVETCNNTRRCIFKKKEKDIKNTEGVIYYKNNYDKKRDIVKDYSEYIVKSKWFKNYLGTDNSIILAWTNKQVSMYNDEIRRIKFGNNLKPYIVGDKLILTDYYLTSDDYTEPIYTSEQIEVIGVQECNIQFPNMECKFENINKSIKKIAENCVDQINSNTIRNYNVYKLKIKKSNHLVFTIYILKEKEIRKNNQDQEIAKEKIYNFIKKNGSDDNVETNVIRILWKNYNKIFVDPFAKINYGYSTTVHKSQASSYKNVFVDYNDIIKNRNVLESYHCLYTAQSRAMDSLHMLI